ncbi:hypothetical protein JW948_08020 [bacterium]|nr:hypothetical protein [bacterium]
MTTNRTTKLLILLIAVILTLFCCKSGRNGTDTDMNADIGRGFLTVLPIEPEAISLFVNLGHMSHPGHTLPSDHGGFYLTDYSVSEPFLCPADMILTHWDVMEYLNTGTSDYTISLSANRDRFIITVGHLSDIHPSIRSVTPENAEAQCEEYSIGSDRFRHCLHWLNIPVHAGDTLGTAGGRLPWGIDFGVFDKNRRIEFASDRFDDSLYPYTVSPLDYFTDEICDHLIPKCGDYLCGWPAIRTKAPIGGTVDYDVPGTAQGLWFRSADSLAGLSADIALVYHNVDPDIPVFSIGLFFQDLPAGPYQFTPADTGIVNRLFNKVVPDGRIYRYDIHYDCSADPSMRYVMLLELLDDTHMKIEKQIPDAGPPWRFTEDALHFER